MQNDTILNERSFRPPFQLYVKKFIVAFDNYHDIINKFFEFISAIVLLITEAFAFRCLRLVGLYCR